MTSLMEQDNDLSLQAQDEDYGCGRGFVYGVSASMPEKGKRRRFFQSFAEWDQRGNLKVLPHDNNSGLDVAGTMEMGAILMGLRGTGTTPK